MFALLHVAVLHARLLVVLQPEVNKCWGWLATVSLPFHQDDTP